MQLISIFIVFSETPALQPQIMYACLYAFVFTSNTQLHWHLLWLLSVASSLAWHRSIFTWHRHILLYATWSSINYFVGKSDRWASASKEAAGRVSRGIWDATGGGSCNGQRFPERVCRIVYCYGRPAVQAFPQTTKVTDIYCLSLCVFHYFCHQSVLVAFTAGS